MPKHKKRKQPISRIDVVTDRTTSKPQATRNVIRRFHVLLKAQNRLRSKPTLSAAETEELSKINYEIEELGGLEWYQRMSAIGQGNDRGGGSEKVFIRWLKEEKMHEGRKEKLRLLEVGALKPDNYKTCSSWIHNTPVDLHSRHPSIKEQDFLLMNITENEGSWDAISLSLVVNFVPDVYDRGRMLYLACSMLKDNGYLFLALPHPCVANSRYMSFELLHDIMEAIGFAELKRHWREGGKMAYWLYQKQRSVNRVRLRDFSRKVVIRRGNRNNFAILFKDDAM